MPPQKWVLFDIGGVLEFVDDDTWQEQWWQRWCAASGFSRAEFDRRIADARLPRIDLTTGFEAQFWAGLSGALGFDELQGAAMRADFWDSYCGHGNHELIEYARGLRGRARTAILSNSADGAREEEERRFGFSQIFAPITYSHELGVAKPEPGAYLGALARMDAAPADVLFIDDHAVAVGGASALGIRSVLHRENAATIAAIEEFLAQPR